MAVYEVRQWVPRWVHEHYLVEAESEEAAIEEFEQGHIFDYVSDRDVVSDRIEFIDPYDLEARLEADPEDTQ